MEDAMGDTDWIYLLVFWVVLLLTMLVSVAYIARKYRNAEEFSILEKAGALYLAVALVMWMREGFGGSDPIDAIVPALVWPLEAFKWVSGKIGK